MLPPRILMIDDHALFRSGMRLVLQADLPEAEILEAVSVVQAVRDTSTTPALVLLDLQLQGINGMEGLGLLKQRWPGVPMVILSSTADRASIDQAMSLGATAYFSKADTSDKIIPILRQILDASQSSAPGLPALSASVTTRPRLTPRQCEVLEHLCDGLSNKMIARHLNVSEYTVRGHVQTLFELLQVTSRSQASAVARRLGIIS